MPPLPSSSQSSQAIYLQVMLSPDMLAGSRSIHADPLADARPRLTHATPILTPGALALRTAAGRATAAIDVAATSVDTVGTAIEQVVDHAKGAVEAIRGRPWFQRFTAWAEEVLADRFGLTCCNSDSALPDDDAGGLPPRRAQRT